MPRYVIGTTNGAKVAQATNLASAKAKARKASKELFFGVNVYNFDTKQLLAKFENGKEIDMRKPNPSPKSLIGATILSIKRTASGALDSLTVMRPKRTPNISMGFKDASGVFHPIRASADYDPGYVGEGKRKAKGKKRKAAPKKAKGTAKYGVYKGNRLVSRHKTKAVANKAAAKSGGKVYQLA